MKLSKVLFLFLVIPILSISVNYSNAQIRDSLDHYVQKAMHPINEGDLIEAYNFFNVSLKKSYIEGDNLLHLNLLYHKSRLEFTLGSYNTSEKSAVDALELADDLPKTPYVEATKYSLINLLGSINIQTGNYNKSIELYRSSLRHLNSTKDSIVVYNNVSTVYKNLEEYHLAKYELLKAKSRVGLINDTVLIAQVLDNLGEIYSIQNHKDAIPLMLQAYKLRERLDDPGQLYPSLSSLANHYYRNGDSSLTAKYALEALEIAQKIEAPSYKNDALGLLTKISKDPYARMYKIINDSLYEAEKADINKFALLKYDVSEYKRKVLESQLAEERQKNMKLIAFITGGVLLVFSIILINQQQRRFRHEKQEEIINTEKKISRRLHDEVANGLYNAMVKISARNQDPESLLNDLEGLYVKTRDISKAYSGINLEHDFEQLLRDLLLSYESEGVSIATKGLVTEDWETVSKHKKNVIYRTLQELMINMKKHSKASLVVISFSKKIRTIFIEYYDNGIGCEIKKSDGLVNMESRIASVKGSINFISNQDEGFKAKIKI